MLPLAACLFLEPPSLVYSRLLSCSSWSGVVADEQRGKLGELRLALRLDRVGAGVAVRVSR